MVKRKHFPCSQVNEEQPTVRLTRANQKLRGASIAIDQDELVCPTMDQDKKMTLRMGSNHKHSIDSFCVRNVSTAVKAWEAFTDRFECRHKQQFVRNELRKGMISFYCSCMTKTIKVKEKENEAYTFEFLIGKNNVDAAKRHIILKPKYQRLGDFWAASYSNESTYVPPSGLHPKDIVVSSRSLTLSQGCMEVKTTQDIPLAEPGEEILVGKEPSFQCPICQSIFPSYTRARAISDSCSHVMCIPCAQRLLSNPVCDSTEDRNHQVIKAGQCSIRRKYGVWKHSITHQPLPNGHHIYSFHVVRSLAGSGTLDALPALKVAITSESLWHAIYSVLGPDEHEQQQLNSEILESYRKTLFQLMEHKKDVVRRSG